MLHVKSFQIIFDKEDGYIIKYDRTKWLALYRSDEKYQRIFDRNYYLIMLKSNISNVYSHKHTKIKTYSIDDLPYH